MTGSLIESVPWMSQLEPSSACAPEPLDELAKNCFPFIQIVNPLATFEEDPLQPSIQTTPYFWTIHDYGNALNSAINYTAYAQHGTPATDPKSVGTQITVAAELAHIIQCKHHWPSVALVDGTKPLIAQLWIELTRREIALMGWQPTPVDRKRYAFLKKQAEKIGQPWELALTAKAHHLQ